LLTETAPYQHQKGEHSGPLPSFLRSEVKVPACLLVSCAHHQLSGESLLPDLTIISIPSTPLLIIPIFASQASVFVSAFGTLSGLSIEDSGRYPRRRNNFHSVTELPT